MARGSAQTRKVQPAVEVPTLQTGPAFTPVERRAIASLKPYERNARLHDANQLAALRASMVEFGWTIPVLIDETDGVLAGHARLIVGNDLGYEYAPVMVAAGWTDGQKRAYILADNKLTERGGWDLALVASELKDLRDMEFDLSLTGFEEDELEKLLEGAWPIDDEDDESGRGGISDGSLLQLLAISISEPKTIVQPGEVWFMGRHVLICASVIEGWPTWTPYLDSPDALFCPHPGPFVLLADKASTAKMVLVQPDVYIAGHILDRFNETSTVQAERQ